MSSSIDCTALDQMVKQRESEHRYNHSLGVAQTNVALSHRFQESFKDDLLYGMGLLHDICREWRDEDLTDYVRQHKVPLEEREKSVLCLLHGPVAADLLHRQGYPANFCTAIRWHTLGSPTMGRLGLILFISDYLEPGRKHITEEQRKALLDHDSLEGICLAVLKLQDQYFVTKGRTNAPSTAALEQYLVEGERL